MCNVSIRDLANYVSLRTRQIENFECNWSRIFKPTVSNNYKAKTLATQLTSCVVTTCKSVAKCRLCTSPHYLNQCKRFRKLKFDNRYTFVINEGLCRCCLKPCHFAKECGRKGPCCQKPGCVRRHTTLLHSPESTAKADSEVRIKNESKPSSNRSPYLRVHNGFIDMFSALRNTLPILPVRIRGRNIAESIITYAFLDNGSTSSFITNNLVEKLEIHEASQIKVTTTLNHQQEERTIQMVQGLGISGLEKSFFFHLQPLLSIDSLPVTIEDIPTQQDAAQYPKFANLYIKSAEAKVEIQIANATGI